MYNFYKNYNEYDECTARGACSISPSLSAVQETLLVIIRQCAFYINKLKSLEKTTSKEEVNLINMFADAISSTAYNDSKITFMIKTAYHKLDSLRKNYHEKCKALNLPKSDIKDKIYIPHDSNLSQIIALGEKYFHQRCKQEPKDKKNLTDLLILIIKNTAENLLSLYEYKAEDNNVVDAILIGLDLLNKTKVSSETINDWILNIIQLNMNLIEKLYRLQKEKFGAIEKTTINLSTRTGKAILLSGTNLNDIYNLLEFTKNENIDIYTHDNLMIAHGFPNIKKCKNLIGHFGNCTENCILDFAVFPGAILITKNSNINTDYLYRGRIFTTAAIAPQGAVTIKNNDFSKLLLSAKEAKGFAKGQSKPTETIGFNQSELEEKFKLLKEKTENKEIKNIVILDCSGNKSEYFENLTKKLSKTCYILSFSYNTDRENSLVINCGNNQPLIWKVMMTLNKYIPINNEKIFYVFSKCDSRTISNMIHLNSIGAKNIILSNCSPNSINPSLKRYITENYGIRNASTPDEDFKTLTM